MDVESKGEIIDETTVDRGFNGIKKRKQKIGMYGGKELLICRPQ